MKFLAVVALVLCAIGPAYALDETDIALADMIAASARGGAQIGVTCALEEAALIVKGEEPAQPYDHMWECISAGLDNADLGTDTARNTVQAAKDQSEEDD